MLHRPTATAPRPWSRRGATVLVLGLACVLAAGCRPESASNVPGETSLSGPYIRVKIGDDAPTRTFDINDSYRIYDRQSGKLVAEGDKVKEAVFTAKGGRLLMNGRRLESSNVAIVPSRNEEPRLVFPALDPTAAKPVWPSFRGSLRVSVENDKVALINVLPLEQYLAGVVGKECYGTWHIETHKAQAIAARTFALYQMKNVSSDRTFDVYDSSRRSQAYQEGAASETEKSLQAVRDTQGVVLTYDDGNGPRLFETFYYSTSSGEAVAAYQYFKNAPKIPPLMGVACTYSSEAPNYRWQARVEAEQLLKNLKAATRGMEDARRILAVAVVESGKDGRTEDGRAVMINLWSVEDPKRPWKIPVALFKKQFPPQSPFRSDRFDVSLEGGEVVVNGRGFGHGVGMSQFGAEKQATLGRHADGILYYYYPGSKLMRVY